MSLRIVTLMEDLLPENSELVCEHGLSIYIEMNGVKILFDTGQSGQFIKNAENLGIDLSDLQYVIMSHGHYDHTGGLKELVAAVGNPFQLILGQDFFKKRYKFDGENRISIGSGFDKKYVRFHNIDMKQVTEDIYPVAKDIAVISNFDHNVNVECLNRKFYKEQKKKLVQDNFTDEIALVLTLEEGAIAVLGCSHPGVVNILSTVERRLGTKLYGVIGGTHLIEADDQMLRETVTYFKQRDRLRLLSMFHCTGEKASRIFEKEFNKQFVQNYIGNEIQL